MRHSRKEVIDRTRREFQRLDRVVSALKPADWRRLVPRPESKDAWTVKDSLAHIVYWKEHTCRVLRSEKRPPELRGLEVNASNRVIYERWRGRPAAAVVSWHRRVQQEVMATLRAAAEETFSGRERGANWPGDLDGHSAWHRARDIEAALEAAATGSATLARSRIARETKGKPPRRAAQQ